MSALWQTLLTSGALALLAAPILRYFYIRFYLSKRLFFESWINLSRNETLNIGDSLAELLCFELADIRKLREQAKNDPGLWNEKSILPALERSFEGYPEFVRHAELLGLPGKMAQLMRLVLLTKPQAIRGSIHQYGSTVRFQLALDGVRGPRGKLPMRCWETRLESGKPEAIPDAVSELAYDVFLDLANVQGFKSSRTFRDFTKGLRKHLAYNTSRNLKDLKEAEGFYKLASDHEGGNSLASCKLGDLLYSQFTYKTNERAIEAYTGALRTDKPELRAWAFRGLTNAYCQRRQRHEKGDEAALESAKRWARFASEFCGKNSKLAREDQASIKKAEAYARQVWAELGPLTEEERAEAFQEAIALYKEAIGLNEKFTVVYNNLSYLYLQRAEKILRNCDSIAGNVRDSLLKAAAEHLKHAETWCQGAIKADHTFHMAYDNAGNIAQAKANELRLTTAKESYCQALQLKAVESYHQALSYQPSYTAAYSDLSEVHSRLFQFSGAGPQLIQPGTHVSENGNNFNRQQRLHAALAWQHHGKAVLYTEDSASREKLCKDFWRVCKEHGVPPGNTVLDGEDFARVRKANCTCLAHEATA